jgi:predicted amidohydrolase
MPDGVLGSAETPSPALIDAAANRLLLDIGFRSYAAARRMITAGVWPHIISSNLHGLFPVMHDDSALDYRLAGAFARLVALGMPFGDALPPSRSILPLCSVTRCRSDRSPSGRADVTVLEGRSKTGDARRAGPGPDR